MLKPSHIFKMSVPRRRQSDYPTGELIDRLHVERSRALLALSHTPVEDRLYQVMLEETVSAGVHAGAFSVRRLMSLTGLTSYSTVRRARCGLLRKLSIEALSAPGVETNQERSCFHIFKPEEIFARRRRAGMPTHPHEAEILPDNASFHRAIRSVAHGYELSRREAQVALSCAEGKTNAEIGARLGVSPETVKFHLRNIFTKFGVRRRTELISRLLVQGSE
jgi:DNA-binding CsgD family transcriptional regulator